MSPISKLKIKNRIEIVPLNNGNLKIFNGSLSQKKIYIILNFNYIYNKKTR